MRKIQEISQITLILLSTIFIFSGCQSLSKKVGSLETIKTTEPMFIHLRGLQGYSEVTRLNSRTVIEEEKNGVKKITEDKKVNFDVKSEILLVDRGQAHIHFLSKTIRKDGDMDLRDLSLPRLNEEIKFVFYPNSEVFKVEGNNQSDFPKTSIFYVPPVSLPVGKVKVGSTWVMKRVWLTSKTSIPVKIHLTSIFKNLLKCGEKGKCADIEIDGYVDLPTLDKSKVTIKSYIYSKYEQ